MAISEGSWDGSASRFTDAQYQRSCVLDRKSCGGDWANKAVKQRCSLPIREPNGDLNRAGVHAAASRIGSVTNACPAAISSAKSQLRSAYKQLGEDAPSSLGGGKRSDDAPDQHRDRALANFDHEWEFRDQSKNGYLGTLTGHFAVFNRWTEINSPFEGHFMERLAPGSFTKTFQENRKNMRVLLNHGKDPSVGMKPLGPIRALEQDSDGAYYEVALLDTSYNRDLVPGLREGQYGASFRFQVVREDFQQFPERTDDNPTGLPTSTITEAKVREFGPVTFGAYEEATAGLRSLNDELVGMDLGLMARSDPKVVASFARILSGSAESANVGTRAETIETTEEEQVATHDEVQREVREALVSLRDNPSAQDWSVAYCLANLKGDLAYIKAKQLCDPGDGSDPDDAEVSSALDAIDSAIDTAIKAQAKDGTPDDEDEDGPEEAVAMGRDEDESADEQERDEPETETSDTQERDESASTVDNGGEESAPADRAPVHGPKYHRGATLKKRAAPLKTTRNTETPQWKI